MIRLDRIRQLRQLALGGLGRRERVIFLEFHLVGLFAAAAALAFIKAAIDLYDAGGDSGLSRLKFHIADHLWTGLFLWIDFPAPP
jgi:hypothetical protein